MRGPSGVRTLSGMELDALDGERRVPDAHHLSVRRSGSHLELVRHRRRRERVVTADLELVGQSGVDAAAVVRDDARLAVQERLACPTSPPNASTIAWCPRHTPRVGVVGPSARISRTDTPACSDRPGPGGSPAGRARG